MTNIEEYKKDVEKHLKAMKELREKWTNSDSTETGKSLDVNIHQVYSTAVWTLLEDIVQSSDENTVNS